MSHRGINWPFMPKPRITRKRDIRDRLFDFGIHFFYGAVLGSVLGLGIWAFRFCQSDSPRGGLLCIAYGAIVAGLVAGIARDEFWTRSRTHRTR
jgi:hypothetical protein